MIVIVDYGLGNLRSVAGAVEHLGHKPMVTSLPEDLERAERLILPGVGAFGDGMRRLRERGLVAVLTRLVRVERRPVLGICLGAQLFATEGHEFGRHEGLGWIDGAVVRLETGDPVLRRPHVGWNELIERRPSVLLDGVPADALFYFVHSYHLECRDSEAVVAECDYGRRFAAAFQQGNIYGTQFHPEKSQQHGLAVLRNFLERG
jgi:glutamine amidotransferase